MLLLILGLVLFLGTHALTMARGPRGQLIARFGEGGFRGLYTAASLAGFAALIIGYAQYRAAGYIPVWTPPTGLAHLALLLNLPVFILLAAAYLPGRIKAAVKHPMLLAVKIWATAHLLANGDLGSMLLFGGFLAWAVAARISLKRRAGVVPFHASGWSRNDTFAVGAGLALYVVFALWLHPVLIGVSVIPER
jgi:uncharacterized membrane protein